MEHCSKRLKLFELLVDLIVILLFVFLAKLNAVSLDLETNMGVCFTVGDCNRGRLLDFFLLFLLFLDFLFFCNDLHIEVVEHHTKLSTVVGR